MHKICYLTAAFGTSDTVYEYIEALVLNRSPKFKKNLVRRSGGYESDFTPHDVR